MTRALRLLAPYLAVLVFWCWFQSAWAAILAYHAQIIIWSWRRLPHLTRGWRLRSFLVTAIPCAVAGPLVYVLLPTATAGHDLSHWLAAHGLSGGALLIMIPYFGLIHPLLEQVHWSELRLRGWFAHFAFAGYHVIVLSSLMTVPWIILSVVVLLMASYLWTRAQSRTRMELLVPALGHMMADLGIILAATLLIS